MKIQEELLEIQKSQHADIFEFVDLITVAVSFARMNGFTTDEIMKAGYHKINQKGEFTDIALTNLNPENPSNEIYFVNKSLNAATHEG